MVAMFPIEPPVEVISFWVPLNAIEGYTPSFHTTHIYFPIGVLIRGRDMIHAPQRIVYIHRRRTDAKIVKVGCRGLFRKCRLQFFGQVFE